MPPIPWHDIAVEIISHIDPCDIPTLLACSLTHPLWKLPAQRRLYHTLKIQNREDMRRWYRFDAGGRLMPYVRHLIYSGDQDHPLRPYDFLDMHGGRFMDFKPHTLEIRHLALEQFDPGSLRSAFGGLGGTLRALLIRNTTLTLDNFLQFINLFPRLQCLGLDNFTVIHNPSPFSRERPKFRGTLNLSGPIGRCGLRFIMDLTQMLPNFSSVRLRLNLSYHTTRRLLEIPGVANNITTMLLGYQDGKPDLPLPNRTVTDSDFLCRYARKHRSFSMPQPPDALNPHPRAFSKAIDQSRHPREVFPGPRNNHFSRNGVYRRRGVPRAFAHAV